MTQTGDYIFRVCFTDDFQAVVIARFVLEKLKLNKVAFMTDVKQDYSVGLTNIAKDYLTKNGATIVKEQSYSSGDKDFRAQLTDLKSATPGCDHYYRLLSRGGIDREAGPAIWHQSDVGGRRRMGWFLLDIGWRERRSRGLFSPTISQLKTNHPSSRRSSRSTSRNTMSPLTLSPLLATMP